MTTLADLQADIQDDIADTTGEYSSQIVSAIQKAQRYCERYSFFFNQTRTITFTTVASQSAYGSSDNSNIPTLIHIHKAFLEDASSERSILRRVPFTDIEWLNDNSASTGEPYEYAYFEQQIWLYPIPSSANYTVRLNVTNYRLGVLSNGPDTNAWLDYAYDMMKERATYNLAKDTLKDPEMAGAALAAYRDELSQLFMETNDRLRTGKIRATTF